MTVPTVDLESCPVESDPRPPSPGPLRKNFLLFSLLLLSVYYFKVDSQLNMQDMISDVINNVTATTPIPAISPPPATDSSPSPPLPLLTQHPTSSESKTISSPSPTLSPTIAPPDLTASEWTLSPLRWNPPASSTCNFDRPLSPATVTKIKEKKITSGKRFHLLLIGDSIAFRTSKYYVNALPSVFGYRRNVAQGSRCGDEALLGFQTSETWEKPPIMYGPLENGLLNPHCRDCGGCNAHIETFGDSLQFSFIAMEYCRDMSLQTTTRSTTQEIINDFVLREKVDMLLFNCGVHDIASEGTYGSYEDNIRWVVNLFKENDARKVFVTTTGVREDMVPKRHVNHTTNARIERVNDIAKQVMQEAEIPVVDFYPMNDMRLHEDGVHMKMEAYGWLARLQMCAIDDMLGA